MKSVFKAIFMKQRWQSSVSGLAVVLSELVAVAFLMSSLSACGSATSQGQVALQNQAPSGQAAPTGAAQFLGSDAALLQPGAEGQAAWVYVNPNVQWSNYKSVSAEARGVLGYF